MDVLALLALILAIVVGVWACMTRSWPLGLLSLAVVFLALSPVVTVPVH